MKKLLLLFLAVWTATLACQRGGARGPERPPVVEAPRRQGVPSVLVLMPDSPSAEATLGGLREELAEEYDLVPRLVGEQSQPADVGRWMDEVRPAAVVLMNNPTLRLYRTFQRSAPPAQGQVPVVAALSSFLREASTGINNLTGVIYEVPLVTSLVNLRALLRQPVRRVGVLHRAPFRAFIEEQRGLITAEGFELVALEIEPGAEEVKNGLKRLRLEDRVDALWVLNDNALLDKEKLTRGWLPALRGNKTPVVVNVASLLSKKVDFGTFAVLPDHRALGVQAASLLSALAERGWRADGMALEYPLSVEKVLDVEFARKNLDIEERQIATVDRLVE